jgi:hypothetical protein
MIPASCKQKGRRFQQRIREDLIRSFGIRETDILSTNMGQSGCDIYLSAAAREIFPFGVECKNVEALNVWDAMEQCEMNARFAKLRPLLVFRRNHTEPRAVLPWVDFLGIWNEVLALRKRVAELEGGL